MLAAAGDPPKARLRMVGAAGQVTEVHLVSGKSDATLETFTTPRQILSSGISSDGHWAFVWHVRRPPQLLSIYDLTTNKPVTTFEPGFAGDLRWTHGATLLHTWGCGTDCQVFRIYDTRGRVLLESSAGMHAESPSMRFMLTGNAASSGTEDIQLIDLESAQIVSVTKDPAPGSAIVGERWDEAHHKVELKLGGASSGQAPKSAVIALPE